MKIASDLETLVRLVHSDFESTLFHLMDGVVDPRLYEDLELKVNPDAIITMETALYSTIERLFAQ